MAMRDFTSGLRRTGQPASIAIIVLAVIVFLISFVASAGPHIQGSDWESYIAFQPSLVGSRPWTILTYPFAAGVHDVGFLDILFGCWWLYGIGGMLERDLGTRRFVIFWLVMTLIPALVMLGVMMFMGIDMPIRFLALPLSGVTVAWATRNPNSQILFMMVIPILAKWVGWITVGLILFGYGSMNPYLGVVASIHMLVAYLYAANKIPFLLFSGTPRFTRKREGWKPTERNDAYFENVRKREQERAERERLRKLFEGSLTDDPEDKR